MQQSIKILLLFLLPILAFAKPAEFIAEVLPISQTVQQDMLAKGTYKKDCPVPPSRLREIKITYYDFAGVLHHDGTLIVIDAVVDNVITIFKELYDQKYPIAKLKRIEFYDGVDEKSLADNNSCCFQCRPITNKPGVFSLHSYGVAIDINPVQNPYLGYYNFDQGTVKVLPAQGINYLNRQNLRPGMAESIKTIFQKNGFPIWGGNWNDPIDFQHFQTSRGLAKLLATMTPEDAKTTFKLYVQENKFINQIPDNDDTLYKLYTNAPQKFMEYFVANYARINAMEYAQAIKLLNSNTK